MLEMYGDIEGLHPPRSPPRSKIKETERLLASPQFAKEALLCKDSQEESCTDAQTGTAQVACKETHRTQNVRYDQV